ncbi:MAG: hypothetical protein C0508_22785, partial [Cyanobacteria bacterium PR.023]|nr:hypothetical protein [Cyanobacteria bacterium PR.023]
MTVKQILSRFRIYPNSNLFQLGCVASVLNVHAQQQRAFNLAWALRNSAGLLDDTPIAIVGAGISGITIAVALAASGRKIHLYDSKFSVIHLQSGNQTRFLHPNIAVWPSKSFGYPLTDLPFLNWRAATAGHVASQLHRQWALARAVFGAYLDTSRLGEVVESIEMDPQNASRNFVITRSDSEVYKVIIVAVGFGIEQPSKSSTKSYWRNDDLAQPVLADKGKRTFLVSGVGDGGLIDVLRLTVEQFHHQSFLQAIMNDTCLIGLSRRLKTNLDWQKFITSKRIGVTEPSFLNLVRQDTKVYLNARSPYPSQAEAQVLHRICVALLIRQGEVEYIEGRFVSARPVSSLRTRKTSSLGAMRKIALIRGPSGYIRRRIDEVVERHNSQPSIGKLFPCDPELTDRLRSAWRANKDTSWRAHYPVEFLADELMKVHLEAGYKIGFVLPNYSKNDLELAVNNILIKLGLSSSPQIREWMVADTINYAVRGSSLGQPFSLSVEEVQITEFEGNDPPRDVYSWRVFAPREKLVELGLRPPTVPSVCLFLNTTSRQ